jgi:hypothetical protein
MTNTDDMTNTEHTASRAAFLKTEGEASKKVENVCKNRTDGDIAAKFFASVLNLPQVLLSSEHFSVDGTLIEAWASTKSFVLKDDGNPPSGKRPRGGSRNAARLPW